MKYIGFKHQRENKQNSDDIQHYTQTKIKIKEHLVVRKDMDVNEHVRDTIQHYTQIQIKVKEQLVVRKDMDVNKHERLRD